MNILKANPTLTDVLKNLKEEIFESLNCHAVGEVVSVNRGSDNVDLKMVYKRSKIEVLENGSVIKRNIDYPIMVDCPIVSITGGASGLYLPIKQGDKAIILFCDRDIDNFLVDGNQESPESTRKHSFTDAIALVGIRNLSDSFGDDAVFFNGETKISLSDKVEIKNSSQSLATILSELVDAITEITVTSSSPGNPTGTPINAPQFVAIKTKLEGLLK